MRPSLTVAELNTQIALEMRVREGAEKMLRALLGTKDKKARRQREEVPVITHVLPQLPPSASPPFPSPSLPQSKRTVRSPSSYLTAAG